MAMVAGYEVSVIDPRLSFATAERFPGVELHTSWPDEVLQSMQLDTRTAVVTLTHDPKIDDPALHVALGSAAFYIGCLGSKRTHAGRLERLREAGYDDDALARIYGPLGLALGARSPAEIALSALAQLTARLRGSSLA
jgi:xanthine dehydrogenase accessory factor